MKHLKRISNAQGINEDSFSRQDYSKVEDSNLKVSISPKHGEQFSSEVSGDGGICSHLSKIESIFMIVSLTLLAFTLADAIF